MGKVFNVVGSYFGKAELIPEGSQLIEFSVDTLASDKDYFEGETYQEGDIKFHARFLLPDGTKSELISIPPSEVKCNQDLTKPFQRDPNLGLDETQAAPIDLDFYYKHEEITKYAPSFRIYIYPSEFILDHIEIEKIGADSDYSYYSGDPFKNETIIVRACNKDNTLKVTLPYNQNPSTTSKSCYYNINPNVVYREDIGIPVGENIREIPFRIECILRRAGSGNGEQRMEGTVPVKVLKQSKKMQFTDIQRIGSVFKSKYFDGDSFDNQGLRVMGKYPWDDRETDITEKCTIKALYNGQLYEQANKIPYARDLGENGGKGKVVITFVDEDNGGKVTTSDEFPEFESRLTFDIYAVNKVILNEPPSTKKFYVGDKIHNIPNPSVVTTQESLITNVTVKYMPAATNPDTTSKNFVIRVEGSADGIYLAGTLKKPGALTFKALYYDKNGREHESNTIIINVEKQIKEIKVPSVGSSYSEEYSNSLGEQKLNNMRLFSIGGNASNVHLSESNIIEKVDGREAKFYNWIDTVTIDGTAYRADNAGSVYHYILQRGAHEISITLKESDENFQYKWDSSVISGLTCNLFTIKVYQSIRVSTSLSTNTAISFSATGENSFKPSSQQITISCSPQIPGINVEGSLSSDISSYFDSPSNENNTFTITPNTTNSETGETYSGTFDINITIDDNSYRKLSNDSYSYIVSISTKWEKPFEWLEDETITREWIQKLSKESLTKITKYIITGKTKQINIGNEIVTARFVDFHTKSSSKPKVEGYNHDFYNKNRFTFMFELNYDSNNATGPLISNITATNPLLNEYINTSNCIWKKKNSQGASASKGSSQTRAVRLNDSPKYSTPLTLTLYPPTLEELGYNVNDKNKNPAYSKKFYAFSSRAYYPTNQVFIFNAAAKSSDGQMAITGRNIMTLLTSGGGNINKISTSQTTAGINSPYARLLLCVSYDY